MEEKTKNLVKSIKELENKISQAFTILEDLHSTCIPEGREVEFESYEFQISDEQSKTILASSKQIYVYFLSLFDITSLNTVKELFIKEIEPMLADYSKLSEPVANDYDTGFSYPFFDLIDKYLNIFMVMFNIDESIDTSNSTKLNQLILERLLMETPLLCKLSNVETTSEPHVYNGVKKYINLIFPKSKNTSGLSFPTKAKVYKPDIWIPECKAAVEYKYIDNENKITETLAGICEDTKCYKDDIYKTFYAVFFATSAFVTNERFSELWKEREFPKNWKCFYVIKQA